MRKIRAVEITALYDCPGSYTIETDVGVQPICQYTRHVGYNLEMPIDSDFIKLFGEI